MRTDELIEGMNKALEVIGAWLITGGLRVILILILMFVALRAVTWALDTFFGKIPFHEASGRVETLRSVLKIVARITLLVVTFMLILGEFGIEIGPLLATAGVVGLAIGFGAQELVKDLISGFFILLEDQIRVGDIVDLDGRSGLVEKINLRTIVLRDFSASVHYVRNGNIQVVKNLTKDYSAYVFDIGVSYDTDVDQAITVTKSVGEEMRADPAFKDFITEPLEIFGLDQFADSALVIKARIKTVPRQQWTVGREFNRRLKMAFDKSGIEIPFPYRTVYLRAEPETKDFMKQLSVGEPT